MTFDSSGAVSFNVPVDGKKYPFFAPWGECQSYTVQNKTDQVVTLTDQSGRVVNTVAAGGTETVNYTYMILSVQTAAATAVGTLTVALYREARDLQTAYSAVAISNPIVITGTVTIAGAVTITNTVTISGAVTVTNTVTIAGAVTVTNTVTVSGAVSITGAVAISGTVTITGAVTISGSVTVTNATIENATGNLATGLLPSTVLALTLTPNVVNTVTVAKAVAEFALSIAISDGFLSVYTVVSGTTSYLILKLPFYATNNTFQPLERTFYAGIPAGGTINVLVEQTTGSASGALKY